MNRLTAVFIKGFFIVMFILCVPRDQWTAKEKHRIFLENSPFKDTKNLSKKERLAAGLPPNTYNERVYELTMNPRLGYPTTEKLLQVQQSLRQKRNNKSPQNLSGRAPGETVANSWQSLGPNNVGGRTRAALFDLSDTDYDKVFAGGVSGGLWMNQDIDNTTEVSWTKVNGVPGNLAVTVIVQDKNEPTLLFAGTGESYTTGDAIGNGIFRSIDGGQNWSMVLGTGTNSASTTNFVNGGVTTFNVSGTFYINDMEFWDPTPDNTGNDDEIIFAALGAAYNSNFDGDNTSTFLGTNTYGLYKSTDKGLTWTRLSALTASNASRLDDINDIEVGPDNTLWLSTTKNVYQDNSGRFYSSTDGTNFTRHTPSFPGIATNQIGRVEIEPSGQDSATFYILVGNFNTNQAEIYKTTDAFANLTKLNEPNDEHSDISAADFTRGQAFYDLEVEVDPTDDDIVYVGGIDWHKSTDGGSTWAQMTRWNNGLVRNYSIVHADQHGLYFRPGNTNQAVVVNDGGVAFVSNLASATTNDVFVTQEKDFITTQFYSVAQTPEGFATDFVTGGTQDNGTHRIVNPSGTPANATEIQGGDGGYTYIDQVSPTYYISNYIYNNYMLRFDITTNAWTALNVADNGDPDYNEGDFINPGALDSNLDILFVNATKSGTERIRRFKNLDTSSPTNDYMPTLADIDESPSTFEVSPYTTTSTLLLVGLDSGKLVKIDNAEGGSPSATQLTNNLGSISDVQFGKNENEILLTYYNYGVNNVYHTQDGGTTWQQKDGDLPDIPVWAIQHNPFDVNEVIIATGLGVWQTDNFLDSTPNWTQSYNGMSDVAVHDLQFRGTSAQSNRVLAGSYGRGIFAGTFQDAIPPVILSLTSTDSDTIVTHSDLVTITATFSEAMAATPTLSISGLVTNSLMSISGSNTTWNYNWVVATASPTNGIYTATVSGSDLAGNAYSGADSITFTISNTLVDTTPPTVVLTDTDPDNIVSASDTVTITATFSEAMAATPTLSISGLVTNSLMSISGSNTTWNYNWVVATASPTNGIYTATVSGSDLAGNAYSGADSITFTISNTLVDTTPPTVVLTDTDPDNIVSASDTVTITATFSEAMAATPTLSISGLVTNSLMSISGSNTTWNYNWVVATASPTNGIYTATVSGSDLAGNAYSGADSITFTISNTLVDTTPPTVVLTDTDPDNIVSASDTVTITATFSEAMAATPTLSISGLVTNSLMSISGSNTTWNYNWVVATASPTNGIYTATVSGSDLAGNAYSGADSITFTISNTLVDTTPPTVVLTDTDPDNIVSASDTVTITATFSEAMAATPTLSISGLVTNSLMSISGSNTTWNYNWVVATASPTNGIYTATVSGSDLAGNAYSGADSITFTISNTLVDTTPPTVVLTDTDPDNIVSASDTVTITATFSEAMAATPTLSISGLVTNSLMSISGSNTTWNYNWVVATASPTNGIYTATVSGSDLAGNAYSGADSITFTISNTLVDTTPPTITGPTNGIHSDLNVVENYIYVGTFATNETVSWTLSGSDQGDLEINGFGYLSFSTPTDYENPTDNNSDNLYEVIVQATDSSNNLNTHSVSITVVDVNESSTDTTAPVITGPSGQLGSAVSWSSTENVSSQGSFQADEMVSWSLSGSDALDFTITSTGTLVFSSGPDYENPTDSDTNNVYEFSVTATDAAGNSSVMNITLSITDINELTPNQIAGSSRWVYGVLNPAVKAFNNPTSSKYLGTDPITATFSMRPSTAGTFNSETIIVRNSRTDLGAMFDENVTNSPGQSMRFTGSVRNSSTGAVELVSGVVNGIIVYRVPPMGYLYHFKLDVTPDSPFGNPASANTQWATGILKFYITY